MATTSELTDLANDLGKKLAAHDAVKALRDASKAFDADPATQRAVVDFNRLLQSLAEKEQSGRPIEVEDKRKLKAAQDAVVLNPLLRRYQQAQMDYADLLKTLDDAMLRHTGVGDTATSPPGMPMGAGGGGGGAPGGGLVY